MTVEVTTKYATTVKSLGDAWGFVMDRLDSVGPAPRIVISPFWTMNDFPSTDMHREFEVIVEGMVEEH